LARALPLPVTGEVEALDDARLVSATHHPTSDGTLKMLRDYVLANAMPRTLRNLNALPSSSSACYELSAARGGVDGFLRQKGLLKSLVFGMMGGSTVRLVTREFGQYCQDSLGTFCLKVIRDNVSSLEDSSSDHAVRCLGVLVLRSERALARSRACALAAPGMKWRVIGVPDALTFIEGTWIRWTSSLLPRKHFDPSGNKYPPSFSALPRGGTFRSLDLSKATDGLSHSAVEEVVRALADAGAMRPSDLTAALRSLGVGGQYTSWKWPGRDTLEPARRGSPMGTPLSFVVLSWINAFATEAFTASVTHGDDAVGYSLCSEELDEYEAAIVDMGGSVNRLKTYASSRGFTLCERVYVHQDTAKGRPVAFCPPPCPPPGIKVPTAAAADQWPLYLRRAERVQKTLFPWLTNSASARLPTCVGGLGFTGRGLKVSRRVRTTLGAACSTNVERLVVDVLEKRTFREKGLFPRLVQQAPRHSGSYYRFRSFFLLDSKWMTIGNHEWKDSVAYADLVGFREGECLRAFSLAGGPMRRVKGAGRPEKTKRRALFRVKPIPRCAPLSVKGGVGALIRLSERLRAQRVRVRPDIASMIRGRTTEEQ